jgi:hypothetical protein
MIVLSFYDDTVRLHPDGNCMPDRHSEPVVSFGVHARHEFKTIRLKKPYAWKWMQKRFDVLIFFYMVQRTS